MNDWTEPIALEVTLTPVLRDGARVGVKVEVTSNRGDLPLDQQPLARELSKRVGHLAQSFAAEKVPPRSDVQTFPRPS